MRLLVLSVLLVTAMLSMAALERADDRGTRASASAAELGDGVRLIEPGFVLELPTEEIDEEDGEQEEAIDLLDHAADAAGILRTVPRQASAARSVPRFTFRPPRPLGLA